MSSNLHQPVETLEHLDLAKNQNDVPTVDEAPISISIRNNKEEKKEDLKAINPPVTATVLGRSDFTDEELFTVWKNYASLLPIEYKAIAVRMEYALLNRIESLTLDLAVD